MPTRTYRVVLTLKGQRYSYDIPVRVPNDAPATRRLARDKAVDEARAYAAVEADTGPYAFKIESVHDITPSEEQ